MRVLLTLTILLLGGFLLADNDKPPVEAGTVQWSRDYEGALTASKQDGKPVFLLFQEIPGCAGCQTFGREVLSHPLLVEAIEDLFHPVLVYNNRNDPQDLTLLKRYREPAWNYQVVRFVNHQEEDLIARRDGVWELGPLASRMIHSLEAAGQSVPRYLQALALEHDTAKHQQVAYAMHCFWTGEYKLGQLEGVLHTEAGWLDGREVTKVTYHREQIDLEKLSRYAQQQDCARKLYLPQGTRSEADIPTGRLDRSYRVARSSDQKKQIERVKAFDKIATLSPMQRTKLNAWMPVKPEEALSWLSPRQLELLR